MNIPSARPSASRPAAQARRGRALACGAAGAWLLACAPALSQVPPQVPAPTLARALALVAEAATAVAPRQARVEVEPGQLDARLTLAPCARVEPYLPSGVPAWGRTRVGLRCTEGATHWNVFLPVTVQVWSPALVAASALPAGARLTDGQLSSSAVDWAASSSPPFDPAFSLDGRTLARPVASGQALRASDLQPRRWFASGDNVRIEATGPGYTIVTEGKALGAGLEGQSVRVRVVGERAEGGPVLQGRAVADHRVEVSL